MVRYARLRRIGQALEKPESPAQSHAGKVQGDPVRSRGNQPRNR